MVVKSHEYYSDLFVIVGEGDTSRVAVADLVRKLEGKHQNMIYYNIDMKLLILLTLATNYYKPLISTFKMNSFFSG